MSTCYNVVQKCGWHAEDAHQEVTDGQVEDKQIGDSAHVPAAQHDEAHHPVTDHAHRKDEQVGNGEDRSHAGFVEVEIHVGDVLLRPRLVLQHRSTGKDQVLPGGVIGWVLCHCSTWGVKRDTETRGGSSVLPMGWMICFVFGLAL